MRDVFEIGTVKCEPGTLSIGYIESAYRQDSMRVMIPLIVLHGLETGPVLWIGSTMHGNEIPGCEVIRRLARERVDPRRLRGTVVAAPVQNPVAYLDSSRLILHDGTDINRVFPGDPGGTLTQRIAYDLYHGGVARADVVLDLHSNAPGAVNFTIVRVGGSGKAWDAQLELAEAFGLTISLRRVGQLGLSGLLQDVALEAGKPALTVELSGGFLWEEPSVRAGVTGVLNVMRSLKMIDGSKEPQTELPVIPDRLTNQELLKCDRGGLIHPLKPIGAKVRRGEPVVRIYDVFGNLQETISSPIDGWILTYPITKNWTAVSGDTVAFLFGT